MNKGDINCVQPKSTATIRANEGTHYHLDFTPSESQSQRINRTNTCSEEPRCDFLQADLFSSCYEVNITLKEDSNTKGFYADPIFALQQSSTPNIYEEPYSAREQATRTNFVSEEASVDIQQPSIANPYEEPNITIHQATTTHDVYKEATGAIQQRSKPNVYEEPNTAIQQASKKNYYNYVESNVSVEHAHKQSVHVISLQVERRESKAIIIFHGRGERVRL